MAQPEEGLTELRVDEDTVLRPCSPDDADTAFERIQRNRSHLRRWLPGMAAVQSPEEERERLQGLREAGEDPFFIWHKGDLVGGVTIHTPTRNRSAEIGYWLSADSQGRGLMTRACAAAVTYAFRQRKLHRVVIRAAVDNLRSRAVPERLGFVLEGTERESTRLEDGYHDMAVYSMLDREWQPPEGRV